MTTIPDDSLIRAAFAPARSLEPTDSEVARVLARAGASSPVRSTPRRVGRAWPRLAAAALASLTLVAAGGYAAVPPLRAAIDDVASSFSAYVGGDDSQAPGRPLRPGESAASSFAPGDAPRVVAEADGYKLEFVREGRDQIQFDLGDTGVALGYALSDLGGHSLFVLGPGAVQNADENGHVPLFAVVSPSVRSVELDYASGPPLHVGGVRDGVVLLADPTRDPTQVVAYDARGDALETQSLHSPSGGIDIHWEDYGPPAPRVPAECLPGAVGSTPPPSCPNG
jgi:hypothetical protein